MKMVIICFWLLCIASLWVSADEALGLTGRIILGLIIFLHSAECVIFYNRLKVAGGSITGHLIRTFLFGVFHLREIKKAG